MKEIWKDIKGYEGLYQISNLGNVKSFPRNGTSKKEKIRKPNTDRYGYHYITLYKNGKNKTFKIHRLVALAFIPNPSPNNYDIINHKNKIRNDNCVSNLEWCDCKYNNQYSRAIAVYQYDTNHNLIKKWNCIREAARRTRTDNRDIGKCCKGKLKKAGGYIWEYVK